MSDSYWKKNEDLLDNEPVEKAPWWSSRPVLIIFLAIVSIVILSLVWHTLLPSKPQGQTDVPYIKAEAGDVKVKPENPGGADIPHKDKMVYDLISAGKKEGAEESLHPAPEKPLYDTKFENPSELSEHKGTVENIKPSKESLEAPVEQPVTLDADDVKEKVATAKGIKKSGKKEKHTVEKTQTTGQYRAQLASLGSQKDAEGYIKTLKKKYKSIKATSLNVVKASVKGKTVYRVQTEGVTSKSEAAAFCKKVKAEGGQCLVTK